MPSEVNLTAITEPKHFCLKNNISFNEKIRMSPNGEIRVFCICSANNEANKKIFFEELS